MLGYQWYYRRLNCIILQAEVRKPDSWPPAGLFRVYQCYFSYLPTLSCCRESMQETRLRGMVDLDAHQKPPDFLRKVYKEYTRRDRKSCIDDDTHVVDPSKGLNTKQEKSFEKIDIGVSRDDLVQSFRTFTSEGAGESVSWQFDIDAFRSREIDGMLTNDNIVSMLIASRTHYHSKSHTITSATHTTFTHVPS